MDKAMKERLIELLSSVEFGVNNTTLADRHDKHVIEHIADKLLANGVILPPCRIGDEVYRISKRYGCWVVLPRYVDNLTFGKNYRDELVWIIETTTDDVLGDTVFLTREEAEAAIAQLAKKRNQS